MFDRRSDQLGNGCVERGERRWVVLRRSRCGTHEGSETEVNATSENTHKQKEQRYRKEQRETMGSTRREGVIQWGLRVTKDWVHSGVHSRLSLFSKRGVKAKMATPPSASDEGISQYELERNQRIAANRQLLVDLGLASAIRSVCHQVQVWWHRHQACTGLGPCNHAAQQMPFVRL